MLLAELEIRHSRPIAPTRRVALGRLWLPADPAPGHGGLLLAGIVGSHVNQLDDELRDELGEILNDMELGRRLSQPRLRHRFQTDVVGLVRSCHKLVRVGEAMSLDLDDRGSAAAQVLGALYAANKLSQRVRPAVLRLIRRATRWDGLEPAGKHDDALLVWLSGECAAMSVLEDPALDEVWALSILGFTEDEEPNRKDIVQRFRELVLRSHPDHGASEAGAGKRISELSYAKRILTAG